MDDCGSANPQRDRKRCRFSVVGSLDVWSLGCVICELVSGRPVFPADSEDELIVMIVDMIGPPPKTILGTPRAGRFFDANGQLKT